MRSKYLSTKPRAAAALEALFWQLYQYTNLQFWLMVIIFCLFTCFQICCFFFNYNLFNVKKESKSHYFINCFILFLTFNYIIQYYSPNTLIIVCLLVLICNGTINRVCAKPYKWINILHYASKWSAYLSCVVSAIPVASYADPL